tara:strand:- start:861 stop:3830 length:2970 start_codon:yes stop_codon:yes gene_type:complete
MSKEVKNIFNKFILLEKKVAEKQKEQLSDTLKKTMQSVIPNRKAGNKFRLWARKNKSKEFPKIFAGLVDKDGNPDVSLGKKGSYNNTHMKRAFAAFYKEYMTHLGLELPKKDIATGNLGYVGLFKASEKNAGDIGVGKKYHKLLYGDLVLGITDDGSIFGRIKGSRVPYEKINESKRRKSRKLLSESLMKKYNIPVIKVLKDIKKDSKISKKLPAEFIEKIDDKIEAAKPKIKYPGHYNSYPFTESNWDDNAKSESLDGLTIYHKGINLKKLKPKTLSVVKRIFQIYEQNKDKIRTPPVITSGMRDNNMQCSAMYDNWLPYVKGTATAKGGVSGTVEAGKIYLTGLYSNKTLANNVHNAFAANYKSGKSAAVKAAVKALGGKAISNHFYGDAIDLRLTPDVHKILFEYDLDEKNGGGYINNQIGGNGDETEKSRPHFHLKILKPYPFKAAKKDKLAENFDNLSYYLIKELNRKHNLNYLNENKIRKIIRKELIKEFDLKKKLTDVLPDMSNAAEKLDNIKNDIKDATFQKLYDASIKENDLKSSNMFRGWVSQNKSTEEVKKALKNSNLNLGGDYTLSASIDKTKYAKNDHVKAAFIAFGIEYLKDMAKSGFKNMHQRLVKHEQKKDIEARKKVDMSIVAVGGNQYPAKQKLGIPEKYLKGIIGKKGETRLAIAIGVDSGKIYSRIAGSGKGFVEKSLKENLIFENIKNAESIGMKDIIKSLSYEPKNIERIKNNISDNAKKEFEKNIKISKKSSAVDPKMAKKYKKDFYSGRYPKNQKLIPLKDLKPSDFLRVMLSASEGFVSQVYDDHAKRSFKYGKKGQIKRYEDVYGGLRPKGGNRNKHGNPTIGYGHLIYGGYPWRDERERWKEYLVGGGKIMSKAEAQELREEDILNHSPNGDMFKKHNKPLPPDLLMTQNMFDALTHYTFNAGVLNKDLKLALKYISKKQYLKAAKAIRQGAQDGAGANLSGRRKKEHDLFLAGYKEAVAKS